MPETAVHALPEFAPPISAAPLASEDIAPGSVVRQSTWEATTGRAELISRTVRKTWKIGELQLSGSGGHGYSVLPGDGSSASAEFYSTQIAERPGWHTKLVSHSTVGWEGGKMVLNAHLTAYEDEEQVFHRSWREAFDY